MKYYSETLQKLFNTEKELVAEETRVKAEQLKKAAAEKAKKEARTTRAKEVEKALKDANAAQKKAIEVLKAFIQDYGYFHSTIKEENVNPSGDPFFDLIDTFLAL